MSEVAIRLHLEPLEEGGFAATGPAPEAMKFGVIRQPARKSRFRTIPGTWRRERSAR